MDKNYVENQIQPNSSALVIPVAVQDYDVLLGRGKLYEKHLGNQNFQGVCVYM